MFAKHLLSMRVTDMEDLRSPEQKEADEWKSKGLGTVALNNRWLKFYRKKQLDFQCPPLDERLMDLHNIQSYIYIHMYTHINLVEIITLCLLVLGKLES